MTVSSVQSLVWLFLIPKAEPEGKSKCFQQFKRFIFCLNKYLLFLPAHTHTKFCFIVTLAGTDERAGNAVYKKERSPAVFCGGKEGFVTKPWSTASAGITPIPVSSEPWAGARPKAELRPGLTQWAERGMRSTQVTEAACTFTATESWGSVMLLLEVLFVFSNCRCAS